MEGGRPVRQTNSITAFGVWTRLNLVQSIPRGSLVPLPSILVLFFPGARRKHQAIWSPVLPSILTTTPSKHCGGAGNHFPTLIWLCLLLGLLLPAFMSSPFSIVVVVLLLFWQLSSHILSNQITNIHSFVGLAPLALQRRRRRSRSMVMRNWSSRAPLSSRPKTMKTMMVMIATRSSRVRVGQMTAPPPIDFHVYSFWADDWDC